MTIKICSTCKQEKLLSEFRKDKSQPSGYQYHCKICARLYHKSAYTEKYSERAKERNRKRVLEQRQFITDYKLSHPCILCKEDQICCLDFHHVDPTQKDFELSVVSTQSIETICREIDKCVVVCKNCHAKIHNNIISLLS